MKILVTGSIAYDILLSYDGSYVDAIDKENLDDLSLSFFSPHYTRHLGGTGANIAWNISLLEGEPLLVGAVGKDGDDYLVILRERGIATDYVQIFRSQVTATAIIGTDSAGHQIAFFHPGADSLGIWPAIEDDDIAHAIVSPRDKGAMIEGIEWCSNKTIPVLFDPGQQAIAFTKDEYERLLPMSAGLIANAYEWQVISDTLSANHQEILERVPLLIVTQGEQGLVIYTREGELVIPACKAEKLVNPTGAGDGLRAGFLMGLSQGWSLNECGRLGAAMGSFVVECEGTLLEDFSLQAVWARAKEAYGEALPDLG